MVFTIPWENTLEFTGAGTVSRLIGLAAAAAWAAAALAGGRVRKPHPFIGALLAFTIWNGLTIIWSVDPRRSAEGFLTNVQIFVWLFMMWDLFDGRTDTVRALQAYVAGAYVSIIGILANFAGGRPALYERYGAAGFEVDIIALVLGAGVPVAWFLATAAAVGSRHRLWRVVNYGYLPLTALALVLTGTRGAVVASLPTVLFVLWSLAHSSAPRLIGGMLALGVAAVAVVMLAPQASVGRIATATTEISQLDDLNGRVTIWRQSLEAWSQSPIVGVGNDAHRAAVPAGKVAHNLFISVVVETGIVGLALFANVMRHVLLQLSRHRGWDRWFWNTELAVLVIGSLTLSTDDAKYLWLFLALIVIDAAAPRGPRSLPAGRTSTVRV